MSEEKKKITVRCIVSEQDGRVVEVIEQAMPRKELTVALRRTHFNSRFVAALESGRRVIFEERK
jgi:hypothetical protein